MNITNLGKTVGVISGINECVNLFQWVRSAISSLRPQKDEVQEQKLQQDVLLQLQIDLQCLRDTLPLMYRLIDRAEWRIHDHSVAELLSKLKDAVYDAEDLLDEFRWHELKVSVEGNVTSLEPTIDFFHNASQGGFNSVTGIQKRLDNLSSLLEKTGIHYQAIPRPRFDKSVRPETTSFPTEPKIFGRDEELKKLIRLLGVPANSSRSVLSGRKRTRSGAMELATANNQACSTGENDEETITSVPVLPIVGIGGVGKTTLAQNICNRPQVKSYFDIIIWTCVSDDFDVKRLTKEVIESFSGSETTGNHLDSLQRIIACKVNKKRLLLILDDMWDDALNENGDCWKRFCAPFTNVLQGSIMLVTTRSQEVADLVCTTVPFPLKGLDYAVFWDFFKQCVFGIDSSDIDPELQCIGKAILPKLKGSPLAAKTLGRLLGMNRDTRHWNNILTSELWELRQNETDILPALRLSYIYLPFHLKRCFSFCAMYPKDHEFEKASLAKIFVAEGFVAPRSNIPLQDIGSQYFEDLVNRSFFQVVNSKYVIHDLMHDMAQLVSKGECFIIKNRSDIQKVPQNVRHLSILPNCDVECSNLSSLDKHKKLRTLLCNKSLRNMTSMMDCWFNGLRSMRAISFGSVEELPNSIINMKHLRYLEIYETSGFESLPSEMFDLFDFQMFESSMYQFLQEHDVPPVHGSATKGQRRQLRLCGYPGESLPSWSHPQNMHNLNSLSLYGCNGLKTISVSENLQHMNPNETPEVLADNMVVDNIFSSLVDVVIEKCEKLANLEQFLPPDSVPAIKRLAIIDCKSLELLPTEMWYFPSLEELKVCNCPKITSQCLLASSLKILELNNSGDLGGDIKCSSLVSFCLSNYHLPSIELQKWSLPVLQELKVRHSASLEFIGVSERISTDLDANRSIIGKFPLLTHLTIEFCHNLRAVDDHFLYLPAIQSIRITSCSLLSLPTERLGGFPFLKDLDISWCSGLKWQSGTVLPLSLEKVRLWNCGDFSALIPSCLENLTSLKSLEIGACEGMECVPSSSLKSLHKLTIMYCPDLVSIGGPEAIANIKVVQIRNCPKLKELKQPMERGN